jgi:uncharacterized protein with HEPN domain
MQPESRKLVWDAAQAADEIADFVKGKTFDDYVAERMLSAAVERKLMVLGEALAQLARRDAAAAEAIPEVRQIVAFRNILVHGYAVIDDRIVWGIVEGHLAKLRATLSEMLTRG